MAHFKSLLVCSIAEFIGSMLFVIFGTGSAVVLDINHHPSNESIGIAFGAIYAVLVNLTAPLEVSFLNPAVTMAMVVRRKTTFVNGVWFVIMQCSGAILGSYVVKCLTSSSGCSRGLGVTTLDPTVQPWAGVGVEVIITFLLVHTALKFYNANREYYGLWCGMTITASHLFALNYTGCGMNPARSLGPAVITGTWTYHWVYWVGPIIGALLATVLDLIIAIFPVNNRADLQIIGEALQLQKLPSESSQQFEDSIVATEPDISVIPADLPAPMGSPSFERQHTPTEMKTYF